MDPFSVALAGGTLLAGAITGRRARKRLAAEAREQERVIRREAWNTNQDLLQMAQAEQIQRDNIFALRALEDQAEAETRRSLRAQPMLEFTLGDDPLAARRRRGGFFEGAIV